MPDMTPEAARPLTPTLDEFALEEAAIALMQMMGPGAPRRIEARVAVETYLRAALASRDAQGEREGAIPTDWAGDVLCEDCGETYDGCDCDDGEDLVGWLRALADDEALPSTDRETAEDAATEIERLRALLDAPKTVLSGNKTVIGGQAADSYSFGGDARALADEFSMDDVRTLWAAATSELQRIESENGKPGVRAANAEFFTDLADRIERALRSASPPEPRPVGPPTDAEIEAACGHFREIGSMDYDQRDPESLVGMREDAVAWLRAWCRVRDTDFAASPSQREPEPCVWTEDESGAWETGCGRLWVFNDGGPSENNVRFCINCGHPARTGREEGAG